MVVYDEVMTTPSPSLELFVNQLVAEKGITGLEDEVLAQVKADLMSRIEDRINAGIVAHLPEDQLPAFDKLLEGGSDEEIQAFCQKHIPDMDNLVASEMLAFRQTYVGG